MRHRALHPHVRLPLPGLSGISRSPRVDSGDSRPVRKPPHAVTLTGILHHIKERLIIMKIQIVGALFRRNSQPCRLLIPP